MRWQVVANISVLLTGFAFQLCILVTARFDGEVTMQELRLIGATGALFAVILVGSVVHSLVDRVRSRR